MKWWEPGARYALSVLEEENARHRLFPAPAPVPGMFALDLVVDPLCPRTGSR